MFIPQLTDFYKAIKEDNRITTSHISVYMALFELWNQNDFQNPVFIKRLQVMGVAKISGITTFHKTIKDLHQFGYIQYFPSYNPSIQSHVIIIQLQNLDESFAV